MFIDDKMYNTALSAVEMIYSKSYIDSKETIEWLKKAGTHWVSDQYYDGFWYNYRTKKVMYKSQLWDFVRMVRRHPEAYSEIKARYLENLSTDDVDYLYETRFIDRINAAKEMEIEDLFRSIDLGICF